jgi:hypothetical protein
MQRDEFASVLDQFPFQMLYDGGKEWIKEI